MQRISSRYTFFAKRIFPVFWLGFIVWFVVMALRLPPPGRPPDPMLFLMVAFFSVISFLFLRKLVFNLVNQVWDAGSYLLVRNKGEEERVPLENIMNVSNSAFCNPPRATLRLRRPGRFGSEIYFIPISSWLPFARNRMIEKLIERIDAARMRAAAGSPQQ